MPIPFQEQMPLSANYVEPSDSLKQLLGFERTANPWEQMSRDAYDRGKEDGIADERERILAKIFPNEAVRNTWMAMDVLLAKLEKWRTDA